MHKVDVVPEKSARSYIDCRFFIDGEYERSQAEDIDRKTKEIESAALILRNLYATYGELQVRWDASKREKAIRASGRGVGSVPKEFWEKPSWE